MSSVVDAHEPDVTPTVLEAKFRPVVARPGMVDRGRVVAAIMDRPAAPVVALVAPPGYGKTTVLAQWAARERPHVAWLTVDEADNDPATFVASLGAALHRIHRADEDHAEVHLASRDRILASTMPRLLSALHRQATPGILVIDDVHRLTDRTCLDALAALLDHLPPRFRVALAARSEPGLPLARLRAQRMLLEIGPAILALDEDEAAALTASAGRPIGAEEVRTLIARTEGWAAGIYLATLALGRGAADDGPASVSGADTYIAGYLRSEFEAGLAADDLRFLVRTSVLTGITPGVAERVSGLPDAAGRLRAIARGNLLVQDVGGDGASYRYHNLLRDFLLAELERLEPGRTAELHGIASAWYEAAGEVDLAFDHALAAGDRRRAAWIASAATEPLYQRGRLATLERWLTAFPPEFIEGHAPLAVLATWLHVLGGRSVEAVRMLETLGRTSWPGPLPDGSSFVGQRAILRALVAQDGPRQMLADASVAVLAEPTGGWRHQALWALGSAHFLLGDLDEADRWLEAAVVDGRRIGAVAMAPIATLAGVRLRRRDWDGAEALVREAELHLRRTHYEDLLIALPVYAAAARVLVHRGDHRRAREMLVRAQLVRPLAGYATPWLTVFSLLELVKAYLAVSDPAGAQLALREAEAVVRHRPALGVLIDDLIDARRRLAGAAVTLAGSSTLTAAELRVLPLLPTYLSFAEIADRLQVSRNTVKTHAMSIYGKLWASSRGEAVERAVELGLLEPYPGLEQRKGPPGPA